jgi:hypothetical protein
LAGERRGGSGETGGFAEEPVEVGFAGGFGCEDEELGDFIGVEAAEGRFEESEAGGGGFDEEKEFGGGFDFTFPAVDGGEAGNDIDAGGEALVDERAGEVFGFFARARGGEDETDFGGGYEHTGDRVQETGSSLNGAPANPLKAKEGLDGAPGREQEAGDGV